MTKKQQELIDALTGRNIVATFDGAFLNGTATIIGTNGKNKKQCFGIQFDDPGSLDGPRVTSRFKGAYAKSYARDAFFEALRVGQGDVVAAHYHNECKQGGIMQSGASQSWIESNTDLVASETA